METDSVEIDSVEYVRIIYSNYVFEQIILIDYIWNWLFFPQIFQHLIWIGSF